MDNIFNNDVIINNQYDSNNLCELIKDLKIKDCQKNNSLKLLSILINKKWQIPHSIANVDNFFSLIWIDSIKNICISLMFSEDGSTYYIYRKDEMLIEAIVLDIEDDDYLISFLASKIYSIIKSY